jgi:hypothetical protein
VDGQILPQRSPTRRDRASIGIVKLLGESRELGELAGEQGRFVLLEYLRDSGRRLTTLKSVASGGSAVPLALVRAFEETSALGWRALR